MDTKIKYSDLEETTRPTLYRALKYWGKKPHNIWCELITSNTKFGDIVYDPFAGSALTFFECIKTGRKPIVADINPLTLFLVEVYSNKYDIDKIINRYEEIEKIISNSKLYEQNYTTICSCGNKISIYNYRWENDIPIAYSYKCPHCGRTITENNKKGQYFENLGYWKPNKNIESFTSISNAAIKGFAGNNISNVWTKRNLEILSFIFKLIKESESSIQLPLLFAFLQTLHLTTKMCALRSEKTNRPLSTSWGRPAYMYLKKHMEQNPLIQFKRSLFEKNGVLKALESRQNYLPQYTFSTNLDDINNVDGIVCLKNSKLIDNISAQLIITDPPYGSIIQYGELSLIWNIWLENFNKKYQINLSDEIIISKDNNYSKYENDMNTVLSNCNKILSNNGRMIMTFNSNNIKDWNSINQAIKYSNLNIEYKYIQKNKRTSEANVYNASELAITDHYFVLKKETFDNSLKPVAEDFALCI